jgi:WD40 repeat protein
MQILRGRRHKVRDLAFSPCGRWLAAGAFRGGVHVWDTANPTAAPQHPQLAYPYLRHGSLFFRADSRLLVYDYQNHWFLYDPAARALTRAGTVSTNWVVPSPDGRRIARMFGSPLRTWVIEENGKPVPESTVRSTQTRFQATAFAPDGATFATAEVQPGWRGAPELTIRAADTAKPVRTLVGTFRNTPQLAFSGDGVHLVARSGASLACWDVTEPDQKPQKAVNPGRKHFVSMAVHPDGPLLTADNNALVRVWNLPALTTERTIEWNIGKLYAVAVSPDGTRAAVGSHNGKVLVWDWD